MPYWKILCYLYINRNYSEIVQVNKKFNIPLKSVMTRVRSIDCDFNRITLYLINQSDSNSFPKTASYLADILKAILRRTSVCQASKWHVRLRPITFYMIIKVPKMKNGVPNDPGHLWPCGSLAGEAMQDLQPEKCPESSMRWLDTRVLGSSSSLGHF